MAEAAHDVTAASADITVDSVRDHTAPPANEPELNINLQVRLRTGYAPSSLGVPSVRIHPDTDEYIRT